MARKIDYLFQRPGSTAWWIKFQGHGKRIEHSLRTSDRRQAELLALPLIAEHRARVLAARPRLELPWVHTLEPGREHVGPDDTRIIATDRELIYMGHNGDIMKTVPNGRLAPQIVGHRLPARIDFPAFDDAWAGKLQEGVIEDQRPAPAARHADDAIIEAYLKHANATDRIKRETRDTWATYRSIVGVPLKDAKRKDGRKLAEHYLAQGLKSATVRKKLTWLTAACNLAITDGELTVNPFTSATPKRKDKERRLPLDDNDMATIKSNISRLSANDQLLLRLLACSGMRLSEAISIDAEQSEQGVRYVTVGHKTEQSLRRVPLPAGVLGDLPTTIKGRLFQGTPKLASKRLMKFLRSKTVGIIDPHKTVHSLRHRAKDRLRAAGCPLDVQYELLGHEDETIAAGYGEGSPVKLLKKWIDKIGC